MLRDRLSSGFTARLRNLAERVSPPRSGAPSVSSTIEIGFSLLDRAVLELLDREQGLGLVLLDPADRADEQRMRDLEAAEPVEMRVDVMGQEVDRVVAVTAVH